MRKLMRLLTACALLAVTSCAVATDNGAAPSGVGDRTTKPPHGSSYPVVTFGEQHRFASGLVVAVSKPTTFQPSDAASPAAEYAIAFEISLHNKTGHRYKLSEMAVTLTVGDTRAARLIDPTQGYTGIVAPESDGLPTDQRTQVNLAFAVTPDPVDLELTLQPRKTKPAKVIYVTERQS